MTWVTGGGRGTVWVEIPPRKRRKPGQPRRFANLKVGDQLMQTVETKQTIRDPKAANDQYIQVPYRKDTAYYAVTDIWFDPVRGQSDPIAGQMVAIARIRPDGVVHDHKNGYPIRGIASQGFHYADRDYIGWCKERVQAIDDKKVIGIGHGKVIRRRPKTARGGGL